MSDSTGELSDFVMIIWTQLFKIISKRIINIKLSSVEPAHSNLSWAKHVFSQSWAQKTQLSELSYFLILASENRTQKTEIINLLTVVDPF